MMLKQPIDEHDLLNERPLSFFSSNR